MFSHQKNVKKPSFPYNLPQGVLFCQNNVEALGCDQGSNNRSFIQHLEKVTIDRPYLIYENRKIFIFYDVPHLLKMSVII